MHILDEREQCNISELDIENEFQYKYNKLNITNFDLMKMEKKAEIHKMKVFVKNFHLNIYDLVLKVSAKLSKIREFLPL